MRRLRRRLKSRFGMTAPALAVRAHVPWYWRIPQAGLVFVAGYAVAYWQFSGQYAFPPDPTMAQKLQDVQLLQARVVYLESQLQVAGAAQGTLAKEMAAMQDEGMRLKEDVAFYKSILAESGTSGVPKIHSVKLIRGATAGEYQYQILLVQSGRHDKEVQGVLKLVLNVIQGGTPMQQQIGPAASPNGIKVKFKYFQRVEGLFAVPAAFKADSLQVQYLAASGKEPALSQTASFPK